MKRHTADVVVVGGGIAGLSVAWQLALRKAGRVVLLEQESQLATHSTARNAAIWLPTDGEASTATLAPRNAELCDDLLDGRRWLRTTGALVTAASDADLEQTRRACARGGLSWEDLGQGDLLTLAPGLRGGVATCGVHVPEAGELDVHAMTGAVIRAAREAGVELRTGAQVTTLRTERGRVRSVHLGDGTTIATAFVYVAAGAWAEGLGASCGAAVPLTPFRRHLVQLDARSPTTGQVLWYLGDEVYLRPESSGLLASPCDEEAMGPCLPGTNDTQLERLAVKLTAVAPAMSGDRVRRAWACLRTFAPDRELVAGPDSRVDGLYWLAGLGGRGMTVGIAAGELAAQLWAGEVGPCETISPARLL